MTETSTEQINTSIRTPNTREKPPLKVHIVEGGSLAALEKDAHGEIDKPPKRKVLIFGQGPVISKDPNPESTTDKKLPDIPRKSGDEALNFWSSDLAQAASVLYNQDSNTEFVVMGGKTGGDDYAAEASLIKNEMEKLGIPTEAIKTEETSIDTVQNIGNYLNLFDQSQHDGNEETLDILGAPYHVTRLRLLMKLFCVPVGNRFRSDALLRYQAQQNEDSASLNELDNKLNVNYGELEIKGIKHEGQARPGYYYDSKMGTENKSYVDRMVTDDVLTRELLEFPEKWLSYVPNLTDDERVKKVLNQAKELYTYTDQNGTHDGLAERLGFDVTNDIGETKIRLEKIKYGGIDSDTFKQMKIDNSSKPWPKQVTERLHTFLEIQ